MDSMSISAMVQAAEQRGFLSLCIIRTWIDLDCAIPSTKPVCV
jgi:hypothetical protein